MSNSNDPKSKETEEEKAAENDPVEDTGSDTAEPGDPSDPLDDAVEDTVEGADADDPNENMEDGQVRDLTEGDDLSNPDPLPDTPDAALEAGDPDITSVDEDAPTEEKAAHHDVPEPERAEVESPRGEPAAASTTVVEHKGGFWPMAFGGVVAAALGFGAAWYLGQNDSFEAETRAALDTQSTALGDLQGEVIALGDQGATAGESLAALGADIATLQNSIATVEGDLAALGDRVSSVEAYGDQITAIDERLTELAKRPIADTVSREAIRAYEDELERLRGSMEEQRKAIEDTIAAEKAKIEQIAQEATQMEERALEEARLAAARSAMTRVFSALDNGDAFEDALAELAENVDDPLDTLRSVAAEGVETQSSLRERFPDAARDALRASRTGASPDENGGVGGILEKMFEVRSVEPRDGDDADAVLSRAEAAVRSGDLRSALTEIEALPDVAKEALSPWVTDASTRLAALDEAHAVAARLNQG